MKTLLYLYKFKVLHDLKDDICNKCLFYTNNSFDEGFNEAINLVLKIIDKHIKEDK